MNSQSKDNLSSIRAFIAIELPNTLQAKLEGVIHQCKLQPNLPVRWLPVNNIHLTLKFLGDVDRAQVEKVVKAMNEEVKKFSPFSFTVGGIGAFPSIRRPRVIWVGIDALPALSDIASAVENITNRLGFPVEGRPFFPHLTIGRVQPNTSLENLGYLQGALSRIKIGTLGEVNVISLCLFRSDLRPTGAIYSLLARADFGK